MEFAVELREVSKGFEGLPVPVLRNLSLSVPRNSVTVLIGPNGSGKTTLMRIMALLEPPDQGSVRVLGENAYSAGENLRKRVAMVFQYPVVFDRTVSYNIAYPLRLRNFDGESVQRTVDELGKRLGLTEVLDRNAKTLSGGQKQRVVLARTLAAQPELLLLDEPNNNLDRDGALALKEILGAFKSKGAAVISTPNPSYGHSSGDFFGILEDGRISFFGDGKHLDEHLTL